VAGGFRGSVDGPLLGSNRVAPSCSLGFCGSPGRSWWSICVYQRARRTSRVVTVWKPYIVGGRIDRCLPQALIRQGSVVAPVELRQGPLPGSVPVRVRVEPVLLSRLHNHLRLRLVLRGCSRRHPHHHTPCRDGIPPSCRKRTSRPASPHRARAGGQTAEQPAVQGSFPNSGPGEWPSASLGAWRGCQRSVLGRAALCPE
jgi:hypothetical protein